jgi:hypothetical protein
VTVVMVVCSLPERRVTSARRVASRVAVRSCGRGGAASRPPYGPVAAAGTVPTVAAPDPTDVARKLRQHDNEFEAVYDLLRVVDGKIDAVEARVTTLDGKVTTLAAKVTAGFERLENTQQQILDLLQRRQDTTTE